MPPREELKNTSTASSGPARLGGSGPLGRGPRRRAGFTLVELAIAVSILLVGLVSVATATSRMHSVRRHNRERVLAQNAARSTAERIQAQAYSLRVEPTTWSANLIADFSPGGTFGSQFPVRELNVAGAGQTVGTIAFVTDEGATDNALGFEIGMPRDLDGDGVIASADVTGDARILPVILTVQWVGVGGPETYRHAFYVTRY